MSLTELTGAPDDKIIGIDRLLQKINEKVSVTRRPRAHHRVNRYPGARRQNETEMFHFTAVSRCVTACNFNIVGAPVTDLLVKYHLKLHIDITLHYSISNKSAMISSAFENRLRAGLV